MAPNEKVLWFGAIFQIADAEEKMNNTYKMDTIIKADERLCIGCGSCISGCPGGLITKKDFPVPI
jgi:ferredoxin